MRKEEIHEYLRAALTTSADATHIWVLNNEFTPLKIGDDDESKNTLAKYVYEANRLKEPVAVREKLTPEFKLHFDFMIISGDEPSLKEIAAAVGKAMMEDHYSEEKELRIVIYGAKIPEATVDIYKGQVVFPDVVVDMDRARLLRTAMIEKLAGMPIAQKLIGRSAENNMAKVLREIDTTIGVEVPLGATTESPANIPHSPMNPIAVAAIVDGNAGKQVSPKPPPAQRMEWVALGLKRTDGGALTNWVPPRSFRKGAKNSTEGSSGKSSGGQTKAGKLASGPDRSSQSEAGASNVSGYSGGGDKFGK